MLETIEQCRGFAIYLDHTGLINYLSDDFVDKNGYEVTKEMKLLTVNRLLENPAVEKEFINWVKIRNINVKVSSTPLSETIAALEESRDSKRCPPSVHPLILRAIQHCERRRLIRKYIWIEEVGGCTFAISQRIKLFCKSMGYGVMSDLELSNMVARVRKDTQLEHKDFAGGHTCSLPEIPLRFTRKVPSRAEYINAQRMPELGHSVSRQY